MNNVVVTWEQNECVQEFLNEEKCSQYVMAEAYYIRDVGLEGDFTKIQQRSLSKLFTTNYTLRQRLMNTVLEQVKPIVNTCDLTQDTAHVVFDVNISNIREKFAKNKIRFDELNKIKDHQGFYQAMTVEEMAYIGW